MKNITVKLFTLGLSAVLLVCGLTACKIDKDININVSATIETKINEAASQTIRTGSWEIAGSTEVTADLEKIFNDAASQLDGYYYIPVALLGTQVVSGTNYCFLSKPTIISNSAMNSLILTYIYVDTQGNAKFLSDERIVLPGTEAESSGDMMVGGWSYASNTEITPEITEVMTKASETLTGAVYEPIAYVGSQVVAGTNHAILCRVSPSTSGLSSPSTLAVVYIYENLDGSCEITEVSDIELSAD